MPGLAPPLARDLAARVLVSCGTSAENARSVASAMVAAELIGQAGHGLRRLPTYAAQAASGKVDGHAKPRLAQSRSAVAVIDAANGFAYPALDLAVEALPALARKAGVASACIRRSHHAGALGLVVERLAEANCCALAFANTPAAIPPWGSSTPLFGTNPIAFAMPVAEQLPVVVDLSLSKAARGKVMAARQRGESIPEGWALDRQGRATTDPSAALDGAMLPIGDAKGSALAVAVELLAAGLVGASFGWEAGSFFTSEGDPPGCGQLLVAFDPSAYGGEAPKRAAEFARRIEAAEGARLPGRRRQALRERIAAEGIPVDRSLDREMMAFEAVAPVWSRFRGEFFADAGP